MFGRQVWTASLGSTFFFNFCSEWCNAEYWPGCGQNTLGAGDSRNTDRAGHTCSCVGCNGCARTHLPSSSPHALSRNQSASVVGHGALSHSYIGSKLTLNRQQQVCKGMCTLLTELNDNNNDQKYNKDFANRA